MFYQRILRVLNRDADPPDLPDQISGGGSGPFGCAYDLLVLAGSGTTGITKQSSLTKTRVENSTFQDSNERFNW